MTVSTEIDHNEYTGNGATTSFPYTFRIMKNSDLVVQVVDLNENITQLLLDTDYSVTGAKGYSGGSVVLNSALANGWQISINRSLPVTQETDLRNQGKFFAEVHEDAFDKLTMLIQQCFSRLRLALRRPSFVANYYDALGYYIRNLRDPSRAQDAATKNYVDVLAQNNFNRSLRVPEGYVAPLPPVDQRKNKIVAMDYKGDPLMVLPESGSAADVLIELAKPTGAGYIGTIYDVYLDKYLSFLDGQMFLYPEMFFSPGETDHTNAFIKMFAEAKSKNKRIFAVGEYNLYDQKRSQDGYDSYMSYNFIIEINGFKGGIDLSKSKVNVISNNPRITAFKIINTSGEIKLPYINGNLQNLDMPSMYIDDCAVRIGANCKFIDLYVSGIQNFPGHGVLVRHYLQDGISSLDDGIPYDISIVAKNIRDCWQSGIVPVTGDTITINNNEIQYSGSTKAKNGQLGTVGHGLHFEPVAGAGGINNRLRNIVISGNQSFNNRMHGLMSHTAIENLKVEKNDLRYNGLDGARYEGAAHTIVSYANVISNNGRNGVVFNCGSLTAFGYPELFHDASFDDTIEYNGADGFLDLSGSKDLMIGGTIGLNGGNGLTLQQAGLQTLSNLAVYSNGKGSSTLKYAINGSAAILTNVRIYNTDPSTNNQRAFNFRGPCRINNLSIDDNSNRFDSLNNHPRYCPANDGSVRLQGDLANIAGKNLYVNQRGSGAWLMPDSFDYISISFSASADMLFPNPGVQNLSVEFIVEILSGSSATFKVSSGTVNGAAQATATPGKRYRLKYVSTTNLSVTEIV